MINKEALRSIVLIQRKNLFREETIEREGFEKIKLEIPFANIISGVRRCGKSTLLKQKMSSLKNFYYLNFEDPRLIEFELSDFIKLDEIFLEEFGKSNYYFFDEIQNIPKWEIKIRTLLDERKYVFLTGSNASLLSKELGTRLTGRNLRHELFPFSFSEFLKIRNLKPSEDSFNIYLKEGGFPDYLKFKDPLILQNLLSDVLSRDIISRYNIRSSRALTLLTNYLLTNPTKEFSNNNLRKMFEVGSVNSIISFISYLEDSYLIFTINLFDESLKKQLANPKKVFIIDNGLISVNSSSISPDYGKLLENLVFLSLRRKGKDIFYFKQKKECDFVIKKGKRIVSAFQVCYNLNEDNQKREIEGILEALNRFDLKEGTILTFNQEDEYLIDKKKIIVKPVWKWLMEKEK